MSELSIHSDEHFMKQALLEAEKAFDEHEIPVGAIVVSANKIIARAYNQVEKLNDVTAHAEILAITSAQNYLGSRYLNDCKLYVTLEPCVMCAGALFWSQLDKIVVGAKDNDRGFTRHQLPILHPKTDIVFGLMEHECQFLLKEFFQKMRRTKK